MSTRQKITTGLTHYNTYRNTYRIIIYKKISRINEIIDVSKMSVIINSHTVHDNVEKSRFITVMLHFPHNILFKYFID